jgi:hypothetical protein
MIAHSAIETGRDSGRDRPSRSFAKKTAALAGVSRSIRSFAFS